MNEYFGVIGEGYLYYDLEVFNKWGERLHSGRFTDEMAWDGSYNGRKVHAGAYVYRIFVQPPIGIEVKEAGLVMVLSKD